MSAQISREDVLAIQAAIDGLKHIASGRASYIHDEYATRPATIKDAIAEAKLILKRLEPVLPRVVDVFEDQPTEVKLY